MRTKISYQSIHKERSKEEKSLFKGLYVPMIGISIVAGFIAYGIIRLFIVALISLLSWGGLLS